jgi:hypothetical protein
MSSDKLTQSLVQLVTDQAIAAITKTTPFGNIPIINTAMNSIVAGTINIVLNKTILSSYVKAIEDDVLTNSAEVMELRKKLDNPDLSQEERLKNEEQLKEHLRDFLSFNP